MYFMYCILIYPILSGRHKWFRYHMGEGHSHQEPKSDYVIYDRSLRAQTSPAGIKISKQKPGAEEKRKSFKIFIIDIYDTFKFHKLKMIKSKPFVQIPHKINGVSYNQFPCHGAHHAMPSIFRSEPFISACGIFALASSAVDKEKYETSTTSSDFRANSKIGKSWQII